MEPVEAPSGGFFVRERYHSSVDPTQEILETVRAMRQAQLEAAKKARRFRILAVVLAVVTLAAIAAAIYAGYVAFSVLLQMNAK